MNCPSMFAIAAAVVSIVVSPLAHAQVTVDPVSVTDISGFRGTQVTWVAVGAGRTAVRRIWWGERTDKPCTLQVEAGGVPYDEMGGGRASFDICSGDGSSAMPWSENGSGRTVEFADAHYLVSGVRVCSNNSNNHRLKGIAIMPSVVPDRARIAPGATPGGATEYHSQEYADRQANCATWHRAVYCPFGQLASGLVVHHTAEEITGLALRCRAIRW